jgi:mono/diheme cytochrome c family protein
MSKPRIGSLVASIALATAPAAWAADGATIYKDSCAKCHGATGTADTAAAKALKVPSLQADANVKSMTAADVAKRIKDNAKHPPTIKGLSEADLGAAAAYVKTLVK